MTAEPVAVAAVVYDVLGRAPTVADVDQMRDALIVVSDDLLGAFAVDAFDDADDFAMVTALLFQVHVTVTGKIDRMLVHLAQIERVH